jgi:hypothetical protein
MLLAFLLLPFMAHAHPGVGIVMNSKGTIYYTDLEQVWQIVNGARSVLVPNVHTHELYVDKDDNLFGEGGYYDASSEKFYHYLWVRRTDGSMDTVIGMRQAYVIQDFSLARDRDGIEYYVKRNLARPDTNHIYRRVPGGRESIVATGNFGSVSWLHPQADGSILYIRGNALYEVDRAGLVHLIKAGIGKANPTYVHYGVRTLLWGAWRDAARNHYVAIFSDQVIRKIDSAGAMTVVYRSPGQWTPLHGLFDQEGRLWVLETSDKNEVRVVAAGMDTPVKGARSGLRTGMVAGIIVLVAALVFWLGRRQK